MHSEWLTKHRKACFWLSTRESTFVKMNTTTAVRFLSSLVSQHVWVLKKREQRQQKKHSPLPMSMPAVVPHVPSLTSTPEAAPPLCTATAVKETSRRNPVRNSKINITWTQHQLISSMF
jgi:hypothetical protein